MEINQGESQLVAAFHLVEKRLTRYGELGRIRRSEIYKKTVVRQDKARIVAERLTTLTKQFGVGRSDFS